MESDSVPSQMGMYVVRFVERDRDEDSELGV